VLQQHKEAIKTREEELTIWDEQLEKLKKVYYVFSLHTVVIFLFVYHIFVAISCLQRHCILIVKDLHFQLNQFLITFFNLSESNKSVPTLNKMFNQLLRNFCSFSEVHRA
jgi:hypothetical protein